MGTLWDLHKLYNVIVYHCKPEDHWSYIAYLSAEDMLKSVNIEEKKFKNIESEWFGTRSMNDPDLWYSKLHVLI